MTNNYDDEQRPSGWFTRVGQERITSADEEAARREIAEQATREGWVQAADADAFAVDFQTALNLEISRRAWGHSTPEPRNEAERRAFALVDQMESEQAATEQTSKAMDAVPPSDAKH